MKSNIETAKVLEAYLLRCYSTGITELKQYALSLGVEIAIQADGLWLSRPGYSQAEGVPLLDEDGGLLYQRVSGLADILWSENDPKPTL